MALKEERPSSCFEIFLLCYITIPSSSSYTTRVLYALKYYILISREEQPYALGVFHDITFRGISTVDLGVSYGITLCGNWVVCAMFLPEEGVFTQPYSISYGSTLWLKKNERTLIHITC